MLRKIIKIDEDKCNGCGDCIPNCPEGALQVIDGKIRLVSDLFCDGLGACIGHCPEDAISIEEREAEQYNERRVMENVSKQGENVIKAHLDHLKEHGEMEYFQQAIQYLIENGIDVPVSVPSPAAGAHAMGGGGCPGSRVLDFRSDASQEAVPATKQQSQLRQWPVQITLVPAAAPYFKDADLLLAADCVPFAYPDFHQDLLRGKVLLIGCPKLDDAQFYVDKITEILKQNDVRSVTVAHMEVPCCTGLVTIAQSALAASGKDTPLRSVKLGIKGDQQGETEVSSKAAQL